MSPRSNRNYTLFASPRSPFGRRIRLALIRLKIPHTLTMVNPFEPTTEFLKANPMGLIPALQEPETGIAYPDSNTILELLHARHGGWIWPTKIETQLVVRRQSTLAAGLMTATVAHFLERSRETPDASWLKDHEDSIRRTLSRLADELIPVGAPKSPAEFTQADWDLAVALEYLDLRWPEWDWRAEHPRLEAWIQQASQAPEYIESRPPPA